MKPSTLAALGLIVTATTLSATVVNVDLNNSDADHKYSGQGAYADPGNDYWNTPSMGGGTPSSFTNLTASDGTTTTTVNLSLAYTGNHERADYNNSLLRDGAVHASSITISGLNDAYTYDLTFYSTFDNFATTFTVGAQTAGVDGAATASPYTETFIDGMTYVTLPGVPTNGAGAIDVAVTNTDTGLGTGTFVTGLQVAQVPEPSISVLSLVAGLGLLIRRRR